VAKQLFNNNQWCLFGSESQSHCCSPHQTRNQLFATQQRHLSLRFWRPHAAAEPHPPDDKKVVGVFCVFRAASTIKSYRQLLMEILQLIYTDILDSSDQLRGENKALLNEMGVSEMINPNSLQRL
jgi:hypothetical protein